MIAINQEPIVIKKIIILFGILAWIIRSLKNVKLKIIFTLNKVDVKISAVIPPWKILTAI